MDIRPFARPILLVALSVVASTALAAPIAAPPLSAQQLRQSTASQELPPPNPASTADTGAPTEPALPAATSSITITLGTMGDFDRKTVVYGCTGDTTGLTVEYINAAPNYLALIPLDDTVLVFNTVLSGSGAKYAAGKYVWWNKGDESDLYDLTQGANAKAVLSCTATNDAP